MKPQDIFQDTKPILEFVFMPKPLTACESIRNTL